MNILTTKNRNTTNLDELYNSLTFEDIASMNLINSILKESLRLVPPAASVFPRTALKDI